MKRATTFLSLLALSAGLLAQSSVKTERQYLSGRGCVGNCKDSVLINMA